MSNPLLQHFPERAIIEANQVCTQLFEGTCCKKFIYDLDLFDEKCISIFMIKLLGYGIIIAGSIVKLPQVLKIFKAKSGTGITVYGVLLELMAITFNSCYSFRNNFPISAWGESISLAIETFLIAFLVLWYDGFKTQAISLTALYLGIVAALTHPTYVHNDIMWWLQSSVLYLAVSGKLLQAFKNYKSQHTGQISAVTAWAIFAGSFARILTTIKETGDALTTITFVSSSIANAVIAIQVLWYWESTKKFFEKGKKKKAN